MTKKRLLTKAQKKFFKIIWALLILLLILTVLFSSSYILSNPNKKEVTKNTLKSNAIEEKIIVIDPRLVIIKDIFRVEYLKPNTNYTNQIIESKGNLNDNNRLMFLSVANSKTLIKISIQDYNPKNQNNYIKINQKNISEIQIKTNPNNCKTCFPLTYKIGLIESLNNKNEFALVNLEDRKTLTNKTKDILYNQNFILTTDRQQENQEFVINQQKTILSITIDNNSKIEEVKEILESLILFPS